MRQVRPVTERVSSDPPRRQEDRHRQHQVGILRIPNKTGPRQVLKPAGSQPGGGTASSLGTVLRSQRSSTCPGLTDGSAQTWCPPRGALRSRV